MRRVVMAMSVAILITVGSAPIAGAETAMGLTTRLRDAGLGCHPVKLRDYTHWKGTAARCEVQGEDVSIETYGPRRLQKAAAMACNLGFNLVGVTNGEDWVIWPATKRTAREIQNAVGGSLVRACRLGRG